MSASRLYRRGYPKPVKRLATNLIKQRLCYVVSKKRRVRVLMSSSRLENLVIDFQLQFFLKNQVFTKSKVQFSSIVQLFCLTSIQFGSIAELSLVQTIKEP